jgi:hypothetical protein
LARDWISAASKGAFRRVSEFTADSHELADAGRLDPDDGNAFAERWIRSAKQECLSKLILFGENSLRRALTEYVAHFHFERNHQGKGNVLLFSQGD